MISAQVLPNMVHRLPEEVAAHTDHRVLGLFETDVTFESLVLTAFTTLIGS